MSSTTVVQEVEQWRVRDAGVSCAALGFEKNPAVQGDYGWSVGYQDVLELRAKYEAAIARATRAEAEVRACLGDYAALDPYLPEGWRITTQGWERGDYDNWRTTGWALINIDDYAAVWTTDPQTWDGTELSILAAMAAADAALAAREGG